MTQSTPTDVLAAESDSDKELSKKAATHHSLSFYSSKEDDSASQPGHPSILGIPKDKSAGHSADD